jgi:hypothetical protein
VCSYVCTDYEHVHIKFPVVLDRLNVSVEAITTVIEFCFICTVRSKTLCAPDDCNTVSYK